MTYRPRVLLTQGLRRLQCMGAPTALVGSHRMTAYALYESVMVPDHEVCEPWLRQW